MVITDIPYKIRYGIGRLIIGCGVYPATMADLHFIVIDYWGRSSDDIKRKWIKAAKKSETTGYLLIDKNIIGDMNCYLINEKEFVSGNNTINIENPFTASGLSLPIEEGIYHSIYNPVNNVTYTGALRVLYVENGITYVTPGYYNSVSGKFGHNDISPMYYKVNISTIKEVGVFAGTDGIVRIWYRNIYGIINTINPTLNKGQIDNGVAGSGTNSIDHNYIGDSAGIGTAFEPEQELKVPVPPVSETDWPGGWISTIEIDSNLEDNPTVNYDDVDDSPKDWYEDENGDIYSVPSGTGPNNPGDILLKTKNKSFSFPPIYPPNYP